MYYNPYLIEMLARPHQEQLLADAVSQRRGGSRPPPLPAFVGRLWHHTPWPSFRSSRVHPAAPAPGLPCEPCID